MTRQVVYPVFKVLSDGKSFTTYDLRTIHRTVEGAVSEVKRLQRLQPNEWYSFTHQEVVE